MKRIATITTSPECIRVDPLPGAFDTIPANGTAVYMLDPDLPEGVHQAPDGRLWLDEDTRTPDGYQRRTKKGWTSLPANTRKQGVLIEVRPTPPPKTEKVGLHELQHRRLPGCDWYVGSIGQRHNSSTGYSDWIADDGDVGRYQVLTLDGDGTVEVLVR